MIKKMIINLRKNDKNYFFILILKV